MTPPLYRQFTFRALGTDCTIMFECSSHAEAGAFQSQAVQWVTSLEREFSRFIPDSLVSRINRAAGREWVELSPEAMSLFSLCDWFHWSTRGVFDPAMLPLIDLWDYHFPARAVPDKSEVKDALARCGWTRVQRDGARIFLPEAGMGIDVGGIGKEYAVDRVFEMGQKRGIRNMLVDFGHDLRAGGEPPEGGPWKIGLENPAEPGRCWGGVFLRDRAVASSGNYLRHFTADGMQYGHILDPRSGWPVHNHTTSVSVIGGTCTEAGIMSTAAFVLGGTEGLQLLDATYTVEGCITEDHRQLRTRRFHDYIMR